MDCLTFAADDLLFLHNKINDFGESWTFSLELLAMQIFYLLSKISPYQLKLCKGKENHSTYTVVSIPLLVDLNMLHLILFILNHTKPMVPVIN